jgi:CheY-like chemotaxis protein
MACVVAARHGNATVRIDPVDMEPKDEATSGARHTVLVVEDEEPVRTMLQRTLLGAGYTVLTCASGDEALELSASLGAPIDLLVTDVVMRGMGGRELADRLTQARPELKVLFVSGYTRRQVGMRKTTHEYLEKPFTPAELWKIVEQILG